MSVGAYIAFVYAFTCVYVNEHVCPCMWIPESVSGALLNCSAPFLVCYLRQFLNGIWSLKVPKLAGQNSAPPHAGTITLQGLVCMTAGC